MRVRFSTTRQRRQCPAEARTWTAEGRLVGASSGETSFGSATINPVQEDIERCIAVATSCDACLFSSGCDRTEAGRRLASLEQTIVQRCSGLVEVTDAGATP